VLADVEKVTFKKTSNIFRQVPKKIITKSVFGEKAVDPDNFRQLGDQIPSI
jgi:hypothetical protein